MHQNSAIRVLFDYLDYVTAGLEYSNADLSGINAYIREQSAFNFDLHYELIRYSAIRALFDYLDYVTAGLEYSNAPLSGINAYIREESAFRFGLLDQL